MNGKCAKCGREREGDRYKFYIARKEGEPYKFIYTDLKVEEAFICDRCARSGAVGPEWVLLVLFGLAAVPPLALAFINFLEHGFGAGIGQLILGLFFLAPAVWSAYSLLTLKVTPLGGECAAIAGRRKTLQGQRIATFPASKMAYYARVRTDLSMLLSAMNAPKRGKPRVPKPGTRPVPVLDLSGQTFMQTPLPEGRSITNYDLNAIREYLQFVAQRWWETRDAETAICERCNGPVPRGYGALLGSSLYHARCLDDLLEEGRSYLRRDPDSFLGQGVLQKAREFAANKQPTP